MTAFQDFLNLILNGDPVDASTMNAVSRQLHGNSQYLKDIFEAAALGSTVFARSQTIETDAAVGMAVYFDATNDPWQRGQAVATTDTTTGEFGFASSAMVWGIVHTKSTGTLGDILLIGFDEIDMSAAIDGTPAVGQYYLSGTDAGKLVATSPPVGIPVLQSAGEGSDGNTRVFVKTSITDLLNAHRHYSFKLTAAPAGTATLASSRWSVAGDDAQTGWLPADDAVFSGNAPTNASFGYNLTQANFADMWPPLPISGAVLEWDKGDGEGYRQVPAGDDALVVFDQNGIWWMSDCEGDVPWSAAYGESTTTTTSTTTGPECPRNDEMRLQLYMTKMQFSSSNTVVTSIRPHTDSEDTLSITCVQTGADATTGDLEIELDLQFVDSGDDDSADAYAFKTLTGNSFTRGPVVSGLKSGNSSIVLTGGTAGAVSTPFEDYRFGLVTATFTDSAVSLELPIEPVRLDGVTEEYYKDVIGLGFPASKTTSYRGRLRIPASLQVTSVTVAIRTWLLARSTGDFPAMNMTYRIITVPTTPTALPTSDSALAYDPTIHNTIDKDDYGAIDSDPITAAPGDVILFTLERPGSGGDGYADEIHLINQVGVITGVTP